MSKGDWLVATEKVFNMRKLCVGDDRKTHLTVTPPYTVVTLESGCRALSDLLELPIYFEERIEYTVIRESRITTPPENFQLANLAIWKPVLEQRIDMNFEIQKLGPIEDTNIEDLVNELEEIKFYEKYHFPSSAIPYIVIAIVILLVVFVIIILCCKRQMLLRLLVNKVQKRLNNGMDNSKSRSDYIELGEIHSPRTMNTSIERNPPVNTDIELGENEQTRTVDASVYDKPPMNIRVPPKPPVLAPLMFSGTDTTFTIKPKPRPRQPRARPRTTLNMRHS